MRIKKINIEDFGGIRGKSFTFSDSFTFFSQKNEFGKSTLIEAIKAGIFGFSSIKNYPFLPLNARDINFDCLIDLGDSYGVSSFYISRKNTGERVVSKIVEEREEGEEEWKSSKNIKNASIFQGLKELYDLDLKEIHWDFWIVDSNSIEEHKNFLKNIKKSGIDLFESINYRGKMPEEILKDLDEKKKVLYTNNKNSNSKIAENKRKIEEIQKIMVEVDEIQRENAKEYQDYLEKREELTFLKKKLKDLKNKKVNLEEDRYAYRLVVDYQNEKKDYLLNKYQNWKKTPSLSNYRSQKLTLKELEKNMERVQRGLNLEKNKTFDDTVLKLVSLEKRKELRQILNILSLLDLKHREMGEKKPFIQSMCSDELELDMFLAEKELSKYQLQYSKLERLRELKENAVTKKDLVVFTILLLTGSALTFLKPDFALVPLIFSLVFLFSKFFHVSSSNKNKISYLKEFNLDEYRQIRKLDRANNLISNLKEPREEIIELVKQDLHEVYEYQKLVKELKDLEEKKGELLERDPELFSILESDFHSIPQLKALFDAQEEACFSALKNKKSLEEELRVYKNEQIILLDSLEKTKRTYEDLWGTCEEEALENILNKAREQEGILKRKIREIQSLDTDVETILSSDKDYEILLEELNEEIEKDEEKLTTLAEAFYKLEEHLSNPYNKPSSDYAGLSVDDLVELKKELREKNRSLSKEYNMLHLLWKLTDRTFEILKTKLKPSYVNRAGEYFCILAPDSKIKIEYSSSSEIVFKDIQSSEILSFDRLSTGTQAQVVLSLKISYLEELDPKAIYPLIVDDALMAYDETRKEGTLRLLEEISKNRQVIYFEAS